MKFDVTVYYDLKNVPHYGLGRVGVFPKHRKAAIYASISKWKAIAKIHRLSPHQLSADDIDPNPKNTCALCNLFINNGCVGCPVFERTGDQYCWGTPFVLYGNNPNRSTAGDEVRFLYSLLEKE